MNIVAHAGEDSVVECIFLLFVVSTSANILFYAGDRPIYESRIGTSYFLLLSSYFLVLTSYFRVVTLYRGLDRQTDRHTHRQTRRQTQARTLAQTDRKTHTHTHT